MTADSDAFLTRWHRIVAERDLDGLREVLAEGATLGAPPYWQKLEGTDTVHFLLSQILNTIEDLSYQREWTDGAELALEFRGHVGDCELQGIDLITLDDEGRLANLDVMIRPVNAVSALIERIAPKMAAFLAANANDGGA